MAAKKVAIIALFATVVMIGAVVAAVVLTHNKSEHDASKTNSSQKVIQDLCQNTYFQQTCVDTLNKSSTNSTNPQKLIKVLFQTAVQELGNVIKQIDLIQADSKDTRIAEAYKSCQKFLDDSIYDLQRTLNRTDAFYIAENFNLFSDDVNTWLSGALAFQGSCQDGFQDAKADDTKIRGLMKLSQELTVNGLALSNEFSKYFPGVDKVEPGRRLMAAPHDHQHWPDYVDRRTRRLLLATVDNIKIDVTVAQDGSGDFRTINEALPHVPRYKNETFVIYIKKGVYQEYVNIARDMWSVMFIGDGPTETVITGSRCSKDMNGNTYNSATVLVAGDNFIGRNLGFANTAGPEKHQAVALLVDADKSVFHNCNIDGYQDSLCTHAHRQFYRKCTITGTIDFIFGYARAVLQNCRLVVRKPLPGQSCAVTAHARDWNNQTTGIIPQGCHIMASPDYPINDANYKTFLGRPWKKMARTIIMDSKLDDLISPEGWSPWESEPENSNTCFYAEFHNRGPGANLSRRVNWPGIKLLSLEEAKQFTPAEFMEIDEWLANKGIPYDRGWGKCNENSWWNAINRAILQHNNFSNDS